MFKKIHSLKKKLSVNIVGPRQSERKIIQPNRCMLQKESYQVLPKKKEDNHKSYEEAINDIDVGQWQWIVNAEIGSIDSSKVWNLIDLSEWVKLIRCKWVDKKGETLKA